jgi:hypothetical protein
MIKKLLFSSVILFFAFTAKSQLFAEEELARMAAETDIEHLPYNVENIVVRGFDGTNPPPRLVKTTRPMLYGYGITAYHITYDSLIFFKVLSAKAIHRDESGNVIKEFEIKNGRYPPEFKKYFLENIRASERKEIWFEEIYIRDKKDNILYISEPQKFCPHCL